MPPAFEPRAAPDLFTLHGLRAERARQTESENACCIRIRNDRGITGIFVEELGQRIQVWLMVDVKAVRVDRCIELNRFKEITCPRTGKYGYTVRSGPQFGPEPG